MGKKILIVIVVLVVLLASLFLLRRRRREPAAPIASQNPSAVSFEVLVDQGTRDRPPWQIPGILFGSREPGPRFDQSSLGARIGNVDSNRLELSAEGGWDLAIETDSQGHLTSATHVAFPIELGGRPLRFICRPADPPNGYLAITNAPGSTELDGNFALEVTRCINAVSGKTAQWPASPMRIHGSFKGIKHDRRQ